MTKCRSLTSFGMTVLLALPLVAQPTMQGTQIKPGEECPPGMTEVRPRTCQAPREAPPSILDYRPKPMLVVPEHFSWKAKFPVIDFHGHPFAQLQSPDAVRQMGREMDSLNLRLMVAANNISGDNLKRVM